MSEPSTNPENAGYMKWLMRGTVLTVVNFFIALFLSFWLARLQVYTLGERLCGIWSTVAALTGWYALLDLGLNYTVSRFITKSFSTKDYDECNICASTGFSLFLGMGSLVLVLSFVFGFGASHFFPKVEDIGLIGTVIILSGAAFALDFPLRAFYGISLGAMRHDLAMLVGIAFRVAGAVMTWLILVSGGQLIALAAGNIILMSAQIWVCYALARYSFPQLRLSRNNVRRSHIRILFGYSIFGLIAHLGSVMIFELDKVLIPFFLAFEYVFPFGIALQFAQYFSGLLMSMTSWMVTWLTYLHAQGHKDKIWKTMRFGFKYCTYVSGFITFGLIAWSEPFITRWILNPEAIESGKIDPVYWQDIIPCTILLTLVAAVRAIQEPNIRYLYATANHHYYAFSNVIEGLLNIELSLIFAMQYGLVGFAWGTLISCLLLRGVFIPLIVCRLMERSLLVFYTEILRHFLFVGIALIIPAIATWQLVAPNYPALFLVGGISAVIYFPVIYLIGFSTEERNKIKGYLLKGHKEDGIPAQ